MARYTSRYTGPQLDAKLDTIKEDKWNHINGYIQSGRIEIPISSQANEFYICVTGDDADITFYAHTTPVGNSIITSGLWTIESEGPIVCLQGINDPGRSTIRFWFVNIANDQIDNMINHPYTIYYR